MTRAHKIQVGARFPVALADRLAAVSVATHESQRAIMERAITRELNQMMRRGGIPLAKLVKGLIEVMVR